MNATDIAQAVRAVHPTISKADAKAVVDMIFRTIAETTSAGNVVSIAGFGKFAVKSTNAREGHNPNTGAPMSIPAGRKATFTAAKALKDRIAA